MLFYYYYIRSMLAKLFGRPSGAPKPARREILRLADVAAEYAYLRQAKCHSCGGSTLHARTGSEHQNDLTFQAGKWVGGTMHDFWTITCRRCGSVRQLTLAVPAPTELVNKILDGSVELLAVPDRDEIRKRFAGQAINLKTVRPDLIKQALDQLEEKGVFHKIFTYPRVVLAVADLTFSEFVSAYFGACYRLAIKKAVGSDHANLMVPESIYDAIGNPGSRATADRALEFLLSGDD
jgi:hypothetical protein